MVVADKRERSAIFSASDGGDEMRDIAERLRNEEPFCRACADLRRSAADEIERLRAVKSAEEIERLQFVLDAFREALRDIAIGPGGGRRVLKKAYMQQRASEALDVEWESRER
jgi:Xaa-Pro aminopeptidase